VNNSPLILNGKVGPDNRGHGEYTYDQGSGSWDSIEALKCVPAPPKEEPKPAPAPEEEKPLAPDNAHPAIAVRALFEVVAQVGIYQLRDGDRAVANVSCRPGPSWRASSNAPRLADRVGRSALLTSVPCW
jgi:hypothetical protein